LSPLVETLGEALGRTDIGDEVLAHWSIVHGLASLWIDGPVRDLYSDRDIEKLADCVVEMLAEGALKTRRKS
jgi:hypothetical protein